MALADVYSLPLARVDNLISATSFGTQALNAADAGVGAGFIAPKTGNIAKVFLNVTAKTGTAPTYRLGIETLAATRAPDGTVRGSGTAKVDLANPATGGAWRTLDAPLAVTVGDPLAVTLRYLSGTVGASNNITVAHRPSTAAFNLGPYPMTLGGGTWSTSLNGPPCMAVQYDDGTVSRGFCPATALTNNSWNSGSAPLYRGTLWTPPSACRVVGAVLGNRVSDTSDFNVSLYVGAATAPAASTAVTAAASVGANTTANPFFVPLAATSLAAGTDARIVVEPTTANNNSTFVSAAFPDAASLQAFWGLLRGTTGTPGPTWTDSAVTAYPVIPVLDRIDDGSGGASAPPKLWTAAGRVQ